MKTVQRLHDKEKHFNLPITAKDNRVTFANYDLFVSVPEHTLPHGKYSNLEHKTSYTGVADSSKMAHCAEIESNSSFQIHIGDLQRLASVYKDADACRYYLHGINVKDGILTATDGNILEQLSDKKIPVNADFIIPSDVIETAISLNKEYKKCGLITVEYSNKTARSLIRLTLDTEGNPFVQGFAIDGIYPDTKRLFADDFTDFPSFKWAGFSKKQVTKINVVKKLHNLRVVILLPNDGFLQIEGTKEIIDTPFLPTETAFNFHKLNKLGAGTFYINPITGGVSVIVNDNSTSLIMPMRRS